MHTTAQHQAFDGIRMRSFVLPAFGVVLIVGLFALQRSNDSPPPQGAASGFSSGKPFGTSALSHGGVSRIDTETHFNSPARTFAVGQTVVLNRTTSFIPADGAAQRLTSEATEAVITDIRLVSSPSNGQPERRLQLRLPDGSTGWVSESSLRVSP